MIEQRVLRDQIDVIREVFMYAHRFRGSCFVVKIDSGLHDSPALAGLVADLALLQHHGIRVAIVPGARKRIDEVLTRYNVDTHHVGGRRVSPEQSISLIKMAAFDVANRIMTHLSARDVNAAIGNWVRARGVGVNQGVDFAHSGTVERIHREVLERVLSDNIVPIFPCIGWSATGAPYNVSSDELAVAVAQSMAAEKLFFVTDGPASPDTRLQLPDGIVRDENGRVSRLTIEEAEEVHRMNEATGDAAAVRRLYFSIQACRSGVRRVHIVDGRIDGFLLKEIFSNLGLGTMVHANEYESVRPMRPEDITDVLRLMRPYVQSGMLLERSAADLQSRVVDYAVSEVDGTIRACCALHQLSGHRGEISALAVDDRFKQLGLGEKLVQYQLSRARNNGMNVVYALTTRAIDWFEHLGFVAGTVADLPEERRQRYDTERKPRVLVHSVRK